MLLFRLIVGLLVAAAIVCFAFYIGTNDLRWRRRGMRLVKWLVLALMGFAAVLVLERLALLL
jgi:uncharacterized membrane protein YecN with MAPEG domain